MRTSSAARGLAGVEVRSPGDGELTDPSAGRSPCDDAAVGFPSTGVYKPCPGQEDGGRVWARVCEVLRARVGERNFTTWIAPLRCAWTMAGLTVEAPDRLARQQVERHLARPLEEALAAALGRPCPIRVTLRAELPPLLPGTQPPDAAHTFQGFVVGNSNAAARAAAGQLCYGPAAAPLILHGPSGVGKSHLLHAIFHALAARGVAVACFAAAQFAMALVSSEASPGHGAFWEGFAALGALLLDDVHSLARDDGVADWLMDGLVGWIAGGHLLVLTADRAPWEIPALAVRMRRDLAHAVVTRIEAPEPALRLAILDRRAQAQDVSLDPRLVARLAMGIGGSVRRLEGALTHLVARARLSGRPIDDALATETLAELRRPTPPPLAVDGILAATAAAFAISRHRLEGRGRSPDLVLARQVAMYLARKLLRRPFAHLGVAFGRDHTTVLHAWRTVTARLATDPSLAVTVRRIEQRLTGE